MLPMGAAPGGKSLGRAPGGGLPRHEAWTPSHSRARHHQQGLIARRCRIPTSIPATWQAPEAMQEVVAGVRVGLDVVEQNPRRPLQSRQSEGAIQPFHQAITLGNGLGNETSSDVPVLFAKPFHLNG